MCGVSRRNLSSASKSVVTTIFDCADIFPMEDDKLRSEDFEPAGDKPGVVKLAFRHLAFPGESAQIDPPCYFTSGHVLITGNLERFGDRAVLTDAYNLVEVSGIAPDPFTAQIGQGVAGMAGEGTATRRIVRRHTEIKRDCTSLSNCRLAGDRGWSRSDSWTAANAKGQSST